MTDETATAEQAPADNLRSSLAAAYAEQETRQDEARAPAKDAAESAPVIEAEADTGAAPETDAAAEQAAADRARGPDGKFVKADAKATADKTASAKAAAKDPAATADPATQIDPAATAATTSRVAPERWTPAQKEMFARQTPEAQSFILDRHRALESDYTKKVTALANFRKDYEPVDQIFAPHREVMRQKGFTPQSLISAWANVEQRLAGGQGIDVIKGLIQGYNIDQRQLAQALGLGSSQQTADPARQDQQQQDQQLPYTIDRNGEPIALPPVVMEKLQRLDALEGRLNQIDQFNQTIVNEGRSASERRVMNHIESFKSATDETGNLKHPHFDEIEDDMATIANGMLARGQTVPPLDELYERAVYANPTTRANLRAAEQQRAVAKAAEEARAKAAAARKAGSSVTGYPSAGQAPNAAHNADRPLREEIRAAADSVA